MLRVALRPATVRSAHAVVWGRYSSNAPAVVAEASSSTAATAASRSTTSRSGGSTFGQRLAAFTAGFTVAGGCAYYFLLGDLWQSAAQIDERIAQLKEDVADANAALHQRVLALEREVADLRAER